MTTSTRTAHGFERPAAGTWAIDPGHADVAFVGRHFGLTRVRGRFTGVSGTLHLGDRVEDATLDVVIDMTTVESGDHARDEHLRSSDLFDVEHHPTARFVSRQVEVSGAESVVVGDLTIRGITRAVSLDVHYLGSVVDPWENERAVFSASTRINREDWGLTWNMVLEAGGLIVSKEIDIEIEVEFIRQG